jgi:fumarate hydratase subunit beta
MEITLPLENTDVLASLHAGDLVKLNGTLYVARDQAHLKISDILKNGKTIPIPLENQGIYYMGPSPTPPNRAIGSCGPTTSGRMDPFTLELLERGLKIVVGKGKRDLKIRKGFLENQSVYLQAFGGCGALYSESVLSSEVVAFEELGTEAIRVLEVKDFKLLVAYDLNGNSIFPGDTKL